jgi:UDP-galactose transporter B1
MTWGFLQERITTTMYVQSFPAQDETISQQWVYPMVLNTCMTATASMTAFIVELCYKKAPDTSPTLSYQQFWKISLSAAMASPIGYFSLKYISYPMMILTKSCKPVPVMFIGAVLYRKSYAWYKYASVVLLCGGISLFTAAKSSNKQASSDGDDGLIMQLFGLFLVLFNLCLDGITNNEQDHIFSKYHPSSLQMMKYTNGWQAVYLSLYLLLDFLFRFSYSDLVNSVYMMVYFQGVARDILIFCLCSCVGQLILFGLIKEFGSLVWITVAVSRQLFTILLSVFLFGHHINFWQWSGILLVFGGLSLEIGLTYLTKPKIITDASSSVNLAVDPNESVDVESISSASPFTKKRD